MPKAGAFSLVCAGLLGLALPRTAAAAWPTDPNVNVPLCTAAGEQPGAASVSDGAGGVIATWQDSRSGNFDIYAQRISGAGTVQWTANGVALCTVTGDQYVPTIVSDGVGGAIVTWQDYRAGTDFDIYVQRISAAGVAEWTADGVALCTATADQVYPTIASDGAGGAIVAWADFRSGSYDIYSQRISSVGTVQWTVDGVALCTATRMQTIPTIASDGVGGAIVAWSDFRNDGGASDNIDVYAQRISSGGTAQWTAGGVAVCTASGNQVYPAIAPDGGSGAVVTWSDDQRGAICAQRISSGGAVQWPSDGLLLCTLTAPHQFPGIIADDAGGAIVTWYGDHNGSLDIYAQRISSGGAVQWTAGGVALCTAAGNQMNPAIASDGAGGAIVTWQDSRYEATGDIYAQRVSAAGLRQWATNGVALSTAPCEQTGATIVADGAGGAIVTWTDYRGDCTPFHADLYAQRVQANGQLGGEAWADVPLDVPLAFALDPVRPNPTRGGALTVRFSLPSAGAASIELLDVAGRRISAHEVGSLGPGRHTLDLGQGTRLAPGLYLVYLRQGASTRVTRVAVLR